MKTNKDKEQVFKTGPYERVFRKYIIKAINTVDMKGIFISTLYDLFLSQHSPKWRNSKGIQLNDKCHMEAFLSKLWEEFITIAKDKGIESAIFIIFKRYEK